MDFKMHLTGYVSDNILKIASSYDNVSEIRIRKNQKLCITSGSKNYVHNYIVSPKELEDCVTSFCKNSIHTYHEYIIQGYIPFDYGYRIGVCGNAVCENNKIINLSDITCINIRVPAKDIIIPNDLLGSVCAKGSVLIYSPPNYGKTTFLKAVIKTLSLPPLNKKVSVIDSKRELYSQIHHSNIPADFFVGYPKTEAIDMAVRYMSPDFLICDEIGLAEDVLSLHQCKKSGVDLICTAHAGSLQELLLREEILKLHNCNTFDGYLGISLKNGQRTYKYTSKEKAIC